MQKQLKVVVQREIVEAIGTWSRAPCSSRVSEVVRREVEVVQEEVRVLCSERS